MLIVGVNDRAKTVDSGEFTCPYSADRQLYLLKESRLWFSLFFIPLVPLGRPRGRFVQCQGCHRVYEESVLVSRPKTAVEIHAADVAADLRTGTPLEMAKQKLVNQGYASDFAAEVVDRAVAQPTRTCRSCQLTYDRSISHCAMCGNRLN